MVFSVDIDVTALLDAAETAIERGDHETAGERYASVGHAEIADCDYEVGGYEAYSLGRGLLRFTQSGASFRRADSDGRAVRVCQVGRNVALDYRDHAVSESAHRGVLSEFAGDLAVIGGDDPTGDYADAESFYDEIDIPRYGAWASEPIFERSWEVVSVLAGRRASEAFPDANAGWLPTRPQWKGEHLPELVAGFGADADED